MPDSCPYIIKNVEGPYTCKLNGQVCSLELDQECGLVEDDA